VNRRHDEASIDYLTRRLSKERTAHLVLEPSPVGVKFHKGEARNARGRRLTDDGKEDRPVPPSPRNHNFFRGRPGDGATWPAEHAESVGSRLNQLHGQC